eukprot:3742065-Pleurochrysis_carterae.AAC.3
MDAAVCSCLDPRSARADASSSAPQSESASAACLRRRTRAFELAPVNKQAKSKARMRRVNVFDDAQDSKLRPQTHDGQCNFPRNRNHWHEEAARTSQSYDTLLQASKAGGTSAKDCTS